MSDAPPARSPLTHAPALTVVALIHLAMLYAVLSSALPGVTAPPANSIARLLPDSLPPSPAVPVVTTLTPPNVPDFVPQPPSLPVPEPPATNATTRTDTIPATPHQAPTPQAPPNTSFQPSAVLRGQPAPAYPGAYQDRGAAGQVTITCTIEVDGNPTGCRLLSNGGGLAFVVEILRWLTSANHRSIVRACVAVCHGASPIGGWSVSRHRIRHPACLYPKG